MLSVMLVQRDSIAESPGLKKNVVRHFLGNTNYKRIQYKNTNTKNELHIFNLFNDSFHYLMNDAVFLVKSTFTHGMNDTTC